MMLIFHPKMKFVAQQQLTAKPRQLSNNATLPSFKVRNLMVKKRKHFTEGECVKEYFLEIVTRSGIRTSRVLKPRLQECEAGVLPT
jgi:hypothetical protein